MLATGYYVLFIVHHYIIHHLAWCVGVWLSLVEHTVRDRGVAGSNPVTPTIFSFLLFASLSVLSALSMI